MGKGSVLLGGHYQRIGPIAEADLHVLDPWAVHGEHLKAVTAPAQRFPGAGDVLQPLQRREQRAAKDAAAAAAAASVLQRQRRRTRQQGLIVSLGTHGVTLPPWPSWQTVALPQRSQRVAAPASVSASEAEPARAAATAVRPAEKGRGAVQMRDRRGMRELHGVLLHEFHRLGYMLPDKTK